MTGKLTGNVFVGGTWYGPAYPDAGDPPAGTVTNPAAFDGGAVPKGHERGERRMDVERTAHDAEGVTREGTARSGGKNDQGVSSGSSMPAKSTKRR